MFQTSEAVVNPITYSDPSGHAGRGQSTVNRPRSGLPNQKAPNDKTTEEKVIQKNNTMKPPERTAADIENQLNKMKETLIKKNGDSLNYINLPLYGTDVLDLGKNKIGLSQAEFNQLILNEQFINTQFDIDETKTVETIIKLSLDGEAEQSYYNNYRGTDYLYAGSTSYEQSYGEYNPEVTKTKIKVELEDFCSRNGIAVEECVDSEGLQLKYAQVNNELRRKKNPFGAWVDDFRNEIGLLGTMLVASGAPVAYTPVGAVAVIAGLFLQATSVGTNVVTAINRETLYGTPISAEESVSRLGQGLLVGVQI